jgi:hypothetical protein
MNPLLPQQQQPAAPEAAPAAPPSIQDLVQQHNQLSAAYKQLSAAAKQMEMVRKQLDELVELGDTVTTEDVVKSAGKLVAGGMPALEVAKLLSEMPDSGQPLASWLQDKDEMVAANEQQKEQILPLVQHQLGVSSVQVMQAMQGQQQQQQASVQAPIAGSSGNALTGGETQNG